jgi:hypothetical protein
MREIQDREARTPTTRKVRVTFTGGAVREGYLHEDGSIHGAEVKLFTPYAGSQDVLGWGGVHMGTWREVA